MLHSNMPNTIWVTFCWSFGTWKWSLCDSCAECNIYTIHIRDWCTSCTDPITVRRGEQNFMNGWCSSPHPLKERSHMLMGLCQSGFLCGTVRCLLIMKLSCASPSELGMGTMADSGVQAACHRISVLYKSVSWQRSKLCLNTWTLSSWMHVS